MRGASSSMDGRRQGDDCLACCRFEDMAIRPLLTLEERQEMEGGPPPDGTTRPALRPELGVGLRRGS